MPVNNHLNKNQNGKGMLHEILTKNEMPTDNKIKNKKSLESFGSAPAYVCVCVYVCVYGCVYGCVHYFLCNLLYCTVDVANWQKKV